jgi:uncharacterized protein (DUF952 family)
VQVLHIATAADWAEAVERGEYRVSTLGATIDDVGFIHASRPEQVQATAAGFYADRDELVVLVMDEDRLVAGGVPVVLEDGGVQVREQLAAVPVALVDEVRPASWATDGTLRY